MPKTLSTAFLAQMGKAPRGVTRAKDGKLTSSRSEKGRSFAEAFVNDPKYRAALRERLLAGVAGPVEVQLLRMAFGDPPKSDIEKDHDQERFRTMRGDVLRFLQEQPDEARVLNAVVTRAPRLSLSAPPEADPEPPA